MRKIPLLAYRLYAFLKKDLQNDISYRFSFTVRWLGLIMTVFMFYYLAQLIDANPAGDLKDYGGYFSFTLIGLAAVSFFNAHVGGYAGTVLGEQRVGTLEIFLTTSTGLPTILLSFALYNIVMGGLAALLHVLLGGYLGVDFSQSDFFSCFVVLGLSTIIFLSLGVMASSCLLIFKRGDPLTWLVTNLFWILGGAYFPVSVFPQWLQAVSSWIPSTYSLRAIRLAVLQGYSPGMLKNEIVILLIFSIALLFLSYFLAKITVSHIRRRGTVTFY